MNDTTEMLDLLTNHMKQGQEQYGPVTLMNAAASRINTVHDKLLNELNTGPSDNRNERYRRRLLQLAGLCCNAWLGIPAEAPENATPAEPPATTASPTT